ncbi:acyl-CoA synthetase [Pseudomonas sp. PD9R]|uniref:acyl-CoA synthetase n=1 Tax=Pseudomonas sp. PD9R TaxID=2853534 RepID=UPI001C490158|nr:AMP-binding protein [Pseudomonas sp. PD9R]MBV6823449.1 AMP-binding protein [Pseudomonas sp. PD9R]
MARNMVHYTQAYRDFQWTLPSTFNFGTDVVDRYARAADGPALIWANAAGEEIHLSYSDMSRLTDRFASVLAKRGIRRGDRVLIMLPRIPDWQVAMVGCLKLGAIPIPSVEMLTRKDINYRVRHAEARAVVVRAEHAEKFVDVLNEVPVRLSLGITPGFESYENAMIEADGVFEPAALSLDDPAILYYTSGSTGEPKGVLHPARSLYAWREAAKYWLDLDRSDVIWCTADVGWSKAGTSILFGPWSAGACTFFYDGPFDPAQRLALLAKYNISVYCAPGTELFRVVDEDVASFDLSRLRHTVSAGERLNAFVAEKWHNKTGIQVMEAFGQTETLMTLANYACMPPREGSMGLPLPGSDVDIIDAQGRRLPQGSEGDIAVRVPNPLLMLGYYKDEARTRESYIEADGERWFITGDIGSRDADGYFFYSGRRDDVINSAGYRIGPTEVENALLSHLSVLECAVIGTPNEERGEIVKAFVILRPGTTPSDELVRDLKEHVKQMTAPYKYPRAIEFVDALPKTQTGKIQRSALRALEKKRLTLEEQSIHGTSC